MSEFHSTWVFALQPGRYAYPLPPDFLRIIPRTEQRDGWPMGLVGPASPQVWAEWLYGGSAVAAPMGWRIRNNVLWIEPTPKTAELVAIEYITRYPVVSEIRDGDFDLTLDPPQTYAPIVPRDGHLSLPNDDLASVEDPDNAEYGTGPGYGEGLYRGAQEGRDGDAIDQLLATMGPGASSPTVSTRGPTPTTAEGTPRNAAMAAYGGPTNAAAAAMEGGDGSVASGIVETAQALGMNPVDLATIISYETGGTFNPTMSGPTTQWGTHRGLIQFGEPQAREYGVNWDDPVGSQLGADGAVARYFRQNGWQPGMSLLDAYSIVNAGGPGLYDRSDARNGGAPGTVRDKVENQMGGHRENAMRLLGGDFSAYATAGQPAPMSRDNMRTLIGLMTNPDVSAPIRDLAGSMMSDAMGSRNGLSPSDQIGLARDMLGLEAALAPPPPEPRFRVATPEEAAAYGAEAGQIGPDGRFYPATPPSTATADVGMMRQRNEAASLINDAVGKLMGDGMVNQTTREEALAMVARDPIFQEQFRILGIDPVEIARQAAAVPPPAVPAPPAPEPSLFDRLFGGGAPEAPAQPAAPAPDNDPLGLR